MNEKKKPGAFDALTNTTQAVAVRTDQFKVKRQLTLDATSIARLGEVLCQTTGELEQIEMPGNGNKGEVNMAWAVPITDLLRTTQYLLICNALLVSAFNRAGQPLAGKYFAIRSGEIKAGKRYRTVDVVQLELAE